MSVLVEARAKYDQLLKFRQEITKLEDALKKCDARSELPKIKKLEGDLARLKTQASETQREFINLANATGKLGQNTKGITQMSNAFGQLSTNINHAASQILLYRSSYIALNQVMSLISGIPNTIMQFEAMNSKLAAIRGTTKEGIKELTTSAEELGRTTVFTATQATEMQIELAKLGFQTGEIMKLQQDTLHFAQAVGASLADAAGTAGAVMRMFGGTEEEIARYTGAMTGAVMNTALDFTTIKENIAQVGPVANAIGMQVEDVLALFGALKNAGVNGSVAATSLRNILNEMAGGKLQKQLGYSVSSLEDFVRALRDLKEAGYEGSDGVAKAMKAVGKRGGAQLLALQNSSESLIGIRDNIMASEGTAVGKMADTMVMNLQGQLTMLKSAWEGLILTFRESDGVLSGIVSGITDDLRKFTEFVSGGSDFHFDAENAKTYYNILKNIVIAYTAYKVATMATAQIKQVSAKIVALAQKDELAALAKKETEQAEADAAEQMALQKELEMHQAKIAQYKEELELLQRIKDLRDNQDLSPALQESIAKGEITGEQAKELNKMRGEVGMNLGNPQAMAVSLNYYDQEIAKLTTIKGITEQNIATHKLKIGTLEDEFEQYKKIYNLAEDTTAEDVMDFDDAAGMDDIKATAKELLAEKTALATAEESLNTTEQKLNTAQTERSVIATRGKTMAKGTETTAEKANTVATATNTTAQKTNTATTATATKTTRLFGLAQMFSAGASKVATGAMYLFNGAVNAAKIGINALTTAIRMNPIGFIVSAVTTVAALLWQFADAEDDATESSTKFGKAIGEATKDVESLYNVMQLTKEGSKAHKDAMDDLHKQMVDYGIIAEGEKLTMDELIEKRQELIDKIREEAAEREKANQVDTYNENYKKNMKSAADTFIEDTKDIEGNLGYFSAFTEGLENSKEQLKQWKEERDRIMEDRDAKYAQWHKVMDYGYSANSKQYQDAKKAYKESYDAFVEMNAKINNLNNLPIKKEVMDLLSANGGSDSQVGDMANAMDEYYKKWLKENDILEKNKKITEDVAKAHENLTLRQPNSEDDLVELFSEKELGNFKSRMGQAESMITDLQDKINAANGNQDEINKIEIDQTELQQLEANIKATAEEEKKLKALLADEKLTVDTDEANKRIKELTANIINYENELENPALTKERRAKLEVDKKIAEKERDEWEKKLKTLPDRKSTQLKLLEVEQVKSNLDTIKSKLADFARDHKGKAILDFKFGGENIKTFLDNLKPLFDALGIDVTKQSWYQNLVGFTQQGGKGGTGNGTTRTSQTYSNAQEKAQNKEEESKKGDDDKTKEDDEKKKAAAEKAKRRREAEERQHLIDKQNKAEKKRERDEQLERDTLVVQAMRDGNEKKLAQIDINYRKEQNAIADWEEKLRQDAINNAKALWEKDPNSKGARDAGQTFWTTEKYKELSGEGFKLTETETQLKANKLQVAELNRINELLKLSNHYETDFQKLNEETLTIMGDIAAMENTRKKLIQIISENANKETEEAKEAVARAKEYNDKLQERIQYAKLLKKYQGFNEGGEYDFFAKYGSSSIRKRAIEEKANVEIDLDMANGKMGKALSEVLERNKDMAEVDAEKTKAVFAEMFSDIENLSVKALEKLHDNASNALKKTKDATQAKEIADRIKEIDERIAELKMPLHQFSIYTEDYYRAVVLAEQASKRLKDSEDRKKNIEDEIESNSTSLNEKLGKIGYTGSVELTPENISKMQEAINKSNATEDQKRTIIELIAEAVKLSKELEDAQQAINENTEAVNRAEANRDASKQSKFLNNYGIKKRKDEETGDTEYEVDWQRALAKIQQDLGNLGNIFSELSIGGEDAQNAIAGLSSGVGAAASFMSGDYVGAALQGVQAIKSFGKALGIGGGNARAVAEITERLTQENERLRKSIEGLTDEMSKTKGGFKSIEAAEKAIELQQKINKNQNEILNAQSGYHSSHHSNDYYINKEFRSGDWGKISSIVGESVRNAYELTMLSPEKLAKIRTNEYDLWKKIVTTGKYNKEEYWDAVADLGDKVNNLEEQLKETLTSTTFDSMYDGFLSTLKEMTGSAQKFSDDFSEMLFDAVINNYAANEFSEKIQKIYDEMSADLRKQGGSLSKSQMDAYKERYKVLGEQAQETVEMLAQMTGYDSIANQSGSTKSFAGMSAEKGDAMEGRLTAIQIAVEGIKAKVYDTPDLSTPLEQLGLSMSNIGTIADENRSILAKSYLCLLEINDNTKSVVQPIKQMAVDIAKIKTNTNKL